jgi:hypothetical protein
MTSGGARHPNWSVPSVPEIDVIPLPTTSSSSVERIRQPLKSFSLNNLKKEEALK